METLLLKPRLRLLILVLVALVSLRCQKNDDTTAVPKTATDLILEDNQFSLLRAAMTYAGAGDALKGTNLTLFAPNDAAFQASGLTAASITSLTKEQVRNLLLYHVLYSPVSSSAVPAGLNSVQTANQGVAYLNKTGTGTIFVNNARVTQADLTVANGVVHVIDRVLTPSTGTVLQTIQTNPNLTLLSAIIRRIGTSNSTLLAAFTNANPTNRVTVFAPSDAAFRADGRFTSVSAIETANQQTLANLLAYHVTTGVVLSNQLQTGTLTTLLGSSRITTTVTNTQITLRGSRNTSAALIQTPDLVATDGVVHIIDKVLLP